MEIHPVVLKRNGRTRRGKGSGTDELREAGTNHKQALKSGIPVDLRRKTKHKENVKILKTAVERSNVEQCICIVIYVAIGVNLEQRQRRS